MLRKFADETRCFDVCFAHIGIFTGGKVLFIAPDKDTALIDLKEKFGPSFDWVPHTTMLIDEPENIYKALPADMELDVPDDLKDRTIFVENDCRDIWDWSEKVYRLIEKKE